MAKQGNKIEDQGNFIRKQGTRSRKQGKEVEVHSEEAEYLGAAKSGLLLFIKNPTKNVQICEQSSCDDQVLCSCYNLYITMRSRIAALFLAACFVAFGIPIQVSQASADIPICPSGKQPPFPDYAALGDRPTVHKWTDLNPHMALNCALPMEDPIKLVISIAARFSFSGKLDALAGRIGSVSEMDALKYWSTTDKRWRELISGASAIEGPFGLLLRQDFKSAEVLSGHDLYFMQDDTRSTGQPIYRMRVRKWSPSHLILDVENITPIRFGFLTLFDTGDLLSVHYLNRLADEEWGYYALSMVRGDSGVGHGASLINRADAYYRFLIGKSHEGLEPLAN